jgi:hypothetical protein
MAILEKIGWDHFLVDPIPSHHAIASPALVGHIDGHNTGQSQFDRAIERFPISQVVVQIGVVEILVFATGLFVLTKHLAVGIFGNPSFVIEEQRSFVTSDDVIDSNPIAHGS